MNNENSRRSGFAGGLFVALVIGSSAIGVISWYLHTNRAGQTIDTDGFDLSAVPQSPHAGSGAAPAPMSGQPVSGLAMMKGTSGVRFAGSNSSSPGQTAAPVKSADKKVQAHSDFKEQARKHEAEVRKFAEKMTNKYPTIRQYGKDWMRHPDLRKLNDDYMRNHDPVAFIMGLTRAPSLGEMVKKYAGSPAIIEFITQGMKEAPGELTSSAMDVLSNDNVVKSLISNIATGIGLPPSIAGMITSSGGNNAKVDQNKVMSDMMTNPAMQNALKQQGQQAPPVPLSDQR